MPRIPIQPGCEHDCDCHIPVSVSEDIKLKILEANFEKKLLEKQNKLTASNNINIDSLDKISGILTKDIKTDVTVGGIAAGTDLTSGLTLDELIYRIFHAGKVLTGIAITTPPSKVTYTEGEIFDRAGMVVTASYSTGETAAVTNYTCSPSGALSLTDTKITVSYTENAITYTAEQPITVEPLEALKACYYEGTAIPTAIDSNWVIESITKAVKDTGIVHTYAGGLVGYLAVAYNKSLGNLVHVYQNDMTQFDLLPDMQKSEVTYDGNQYFIYTFTEQAALSNDKYDFLFK